jgi:2-phosphosulfolactate phosphatase
MKTLEVLFSPAEFGALKQRNLADTVCVVLDILRASSSMITALGNGASAIIPVAGIPEALAWREREPDVLLAGERDGLRIRAAQTFSRDFDLGNSPREFTRDKVEGKNIVMTTTNGTRALQACAHAYHVVIGSFLNLSATARACRLINDVATPDNVLIICSGTLEQTAYEDVLAAGALCELIWNQGRDVNEELEFSDSASMARILYQNAREHLMDSVSNSRNGRRLLANPDLKQDVAFCVQRDMFQFAAVLNPGGKVEMIW